MQIDNLSNKAGGRVMTDLNGIVGWAKVNIDGVSRIVEIIEWLDNDMVLCEERTHEEKIFTKINRKDILHFII